MKAVLITGLVAGAAARTDVFSSWAVKHGKAYATKEERVMRRSIFAANVAKISAHNGDASATFKMAVNKFADLTGPEFKARYASGLKAKAPAAKLLGAKNATKAAAAPPASVDWSAKGAVTPIKNQGQCGSCWAFSTTGALEGATFISTGKLPSLSEQMLVDCSQSAGNQGCNGGLMDYAFAWIKSNGGIASESAYPYTGTDGTCKQSPSVSNVASYTDVTPNSEAALTAAIAQQPVSVAVEADQSSFQFYSTGVMTAACGTNLDHGVLAVGYGALNNVNYYKVKNSWGSDWGMAGYILLAKGGSTYNGNSGQCGIQSQPSWPTYAAPGPAPSPVPQPSSGPSHDTTSGGGSTTTTGGGGSTTTTGGGGGSTTTTGGGGSTTTGAKLAAKIRQH